MIPTELTILLPCHSLEDFPLDRTGVEAEGLLAAWSALWHPALIAAAGSTMRWYRADYPPDDVTGRLVIVPEASERLLLSDWPERTADQAAAVVRRQSDRGAIIEQLLAAVADQPGVDDQELVSDFLALGYAHLGLELLTRQMRYISNLDEVHFEQQIVAAAREAVAGDVESARQHLCTTFDVLMEGRERFYPVDAYLLDLTLTAPTTLGAPLRRELSGGAPVNLLVTAETLEQMARQEPETLAALVDALDRGACALVGGEYREGPLALMTPEEIRDELMRGGAVYERLVGRRPKVFGRRTAGLNPALPQILSRMGYLGAVHTLLAEGEIPRTGQSKARWQGWDQSSIDAFARVPLDARLPGTFLNLPERLGETMDLDHVASLALAHWPGDSSSWYAELRRIHRYAPLFGKFVTADEYFSQTDTAGRFAKFSADEYRSPYLLQATRSGASDPLSRHVERAKDAAARMAAGGATTMLAALVPAADTKGDACTVDNTGTIERLLAEAITRQGDAQRRGTLLLNPLSFARREAVDGVSAAGAPVWQTVEVPAMGFAWVADGPLADAPARKKPPRPLAHELTLGNEHFEIRVHPETGGIASLHDYRTRGNRLSQQLAMRCHVDGAEYSTMQAESITVTIADPAVGEIASLGRLIDPQGVVLARFEQRLRAVRGSRVAEITVRLDVDAQPEGDPWHSYYASRFAWADESAELRRSIAGTSQPTEARRIEAPHFIEICDDRTRTALLTGGLPYHRRSGERMLDMLLVVAGETAREFRLGIGVDLPSAEAASIGLLAPAPARLADMPCPRGHESGWLFRLESNHAMATHWAPLTLSAAEHEDRSGATGVRVRILETEGRSGRARLQAFRPIAAARQVDLQGAQLIELKVVDDAVALDVGAYEWMEIEVEWRDD